MNKDPAGKSENSPDKKTSYVIPEQSEDENKLIEGIIERTPVIPTADQSKDPKSGISPPTQRREIFKSARVPNDKISPKLPSIAFALSQNTLDQKKGILNSKQFLKTKEEDVKIPSKNSQDKDADIHISRPPLS